MTFQKLTYQLANGTVSGYIANKAINFTARPSQTGSQPPPGNYQIHPPVKDPIYGLVALMTPAGSSPSGVAGIHAAKQGPLRQITPFIKSKVPANLPNAHGWNLSKPVSDASVFVLTSRPISGQNSLVVTSGFADLIDALQAADGASVTVA